MAGGEFNNDTWMYDWTTEIWTQKQNMTIGRYYMPCALFTFTNGSQVVLAAGKLEILEIYIVQNDNEIM